MAARSKTAPRAVLPSPQSFARAFGVGHSDRIQAVDACGVVLSSIQGLHSELMQLDREMARVRREIGRLKK
jgi:hypothetical protein